MVDIADVYAGEEERKLLGEILERRYLGMLTVVHATLLRLFGFDAENFRLPDSATNAMLVEAAHRVVRIDEVTRMAIAEQLRVGQALGLSTHEIAYGVPRIGYHGVDGLYRETWKGRPELIARTELQNAQNEASLNRYAGTGMVDKVKIVDGDDWDDPCRQRNGKTVAISDHPRLNHPRCTLNVIPVLRDGILDRPAALPPQAPQAARWGEWQSIAEAEQIAAARYPNIRFDFTGAHLETIDPTLRQFDVLAKQYPEVAKRLEYIGTYAGEGAPANPSPWKDTTYAHATRDGKIIAINPHFYGRPKALAESVRYSESTKWHPKGTTGVESVMTHEFGHQVDNWLQSVPSRFAGFNVVDMGGNGLIRDTYLHWRYKNKATKALSAYAGKSVEEGFAEAFAAQYHGTDAVKKMAYVRRQRVMLEQLGNPDKWLDEDEWQYSRDISIDTRAAARERLLEWVRRMDA
jgi:hypothetical protein